MTVRWASLALLALTSCLDPKQGRVAQQGSVTTTPPPQPLYECGHQEAEVAGRVDVSVLLVMDRSSSMAGVRWEQTRAAVEAAVGAYDRYLRVGLMMYPSGEDRCDAVEASLAVPIALDTSGDIADAMADAELYRGTPTGAALDAAAELLEADDGAHRVAVLATDGVPDCTAEGWDNGSGLAYESAYEAAEHLAFRGIPVYVVGIQGSDFAHGVLDRIAANGGTRVAYDTSSGDELTEALIDIALDADGCSVALEPPDDAVEMHVTIDGVPSSDGFALDDTQLRIRGLACLAAPGEAHAVGVTWYCQ